MGHRDKEHHLATEGILEILHVHAGQHRDPGLRGPGPDHLDVEGGLGRLLQGVPDDAAPGLLLVHLDHVILLHLQRLRGLVVINSATVK